jgi:hypothetical protein
MKMKRDVDLAINDLSDIERRGEDWQSLEACFAKVAKCRSRAKSFALSNSFSNVPAARSHAIAS